MITAKDESINLISYEPDMATVEERLAVLIGGSHAEEAARAIREKFGTLGTIFAAHPHELLQVKGVGRAAVARIKAAHSLGKKLYTSVPDERPMIKSPADAAQMLMANALSAEQEYLHIFMLDTRNRLIGRPVELYHGSLNTSLIRVGEVFKEAVRCNAAAIIVAHNHPSGDPSPSPEDVAVTRAIAEAGKLLDVELLDHLIIGHNRFVSLKERGLGFG